MTLELLSSGVCVILVSHGWHEVSFPVNVILVVASFGARAETQHGKRYRSWDSVCFVCRFGCALRVK